MAKFCPNCGAQVRDTMKFCAKCGTKVERQTSEQPQPMHEHPQYGKPYPAQQPLRYEQPQPAQQPPKYEQPQPAQQPVRYEPPQPAQQPLMYEPPEPAQEPPQYEQPQPVQDPPQYEQTHPAVQQASPQYAPQQPYVQPNQQYSPEHPHMQSYEAVAPKKKRRIHPVLLILITLVVFCAAVVGVIILIIGNAANQDFIKIRGDKVPSVKYILGEKRNVISVSSSVVNGVSERVIEYSVSANQREEMITYISALNYDYGYAHIKDNDLSGPIGTDIILAKESVEDGYVVIVRIDYSLKGYTITISLEKGTLTVYGESPPSGNTPPPTVIESPSTESQNPIPPPEPTSPDPGPQITESPSPATELPPANSLLDSYLDTVSDNTFYMNIHMKTGTDTADDGTSYGIGVDMTCEMAKQGDMVAMSFEDYDMRMVIKDKKSYTIMASMETVIVSDSVEGLGLDALIPEIVDLTFIKTGSDTLFDKVLQYEAYYPGSDPNSEIRFYSNGGILAGLQQLTNGRITMSMEIFEFSKNVPPEMFDIPEDYSIIEG